MTSLFVMRSPRKGFGASVGPTAQCFKGCLQKACLESTLCFGNALPLVTTPCRVIIECLVLGEVCLTRGSKPSCSPVPTNAVAFLQYLKVYFAITQRTPKVFLRILLPDEQFRSVANPPENKTVQLSQFSPVGQDNPDVQTKLPDDDLEGTPLF